MILFFLKHVLTVGWHHNGDRELVEETAGRFLHLSVSQNEQHAVEILI
jgi:hypothetical protein